MVGLALFIAIGGDAWMLRGIAHTFDLVPLTGAPTSLAGDAADMAAGTIFVSALEIAAPAMLALLITDVAFGLVSKVVPQLNVFAVGFPLKIGVALLVVAASLPFLGGWLSNQIDGSVATALHALCDRNSMAVTTRQRSRQPSAADEAREKGQVAKSVDLNGAACCGRPDRRHRHRPEDRHRRRRARCARSSARSPTRAP